MPYLNYDIDLLYQAVADTMASVWPIIAPAFAIMLATMVISGMAFALYKFIDDKR